MDFQNYYNPFMQDEEKKCIENAWTYYYKQIGDYQLEDGTYKPEFFEMVSDFEKRLNYAKQNTSLPDNPDMKKVEEFVMSVNRRAIDA